MALCSSKRVVARLKLVTATAKMLAPESPDQDANDGTANCSHADDGAVSLRDDRVGNAKQKPENQSHRPSGPRQSNSSDHEPNPEAGDESCRDRCLLVRETHGQQDPNV